MTLEKSLRWFYVLLVFSIGLCSGAMLAPVLYDQVNSIETSDGDRYGDIFQPLRVNLKSGIRTCRRGKPWIKLGSSDKSDWPMLHAGNSMTFSNPTDRTAKFDAVCTLLSYGDDSTKKNEPARLDWSNKYIILGPGMTKTVEFHLRHIYSTDIKKKGPEFRVYCICSSADYEVQGDPVVLMLPVTGEQK